MCASRAASASDAAAPPTRPARSAARPHDEAVSEVIGQILMFGILSMVLILSLLGFNVAKDGAENRVAELEADSAAQRVAGVYISASLFAEQNAENEVEFQRLVDLPDRIQERDYSFSVLGEVLTLTIPSANVQVTTSLLSAGAPPDLVVCNQSNLPGGPIMVRARAYAPLTDATLCPNGLSNTIILFLESA